MKVNLKSRKNQQEIAKQY